MWHLNYSGNPLSLNWYLIYDAAPYNNTANYPNEFYSAIGTNGEPNRPTILPYACIWTLETELYYYGGKSDSHGTTLPFFFLLVLT